MFNVITVKEFGHIQLNCQYKDKKLGESSSSRGDKATCADYESMFMVHTKIELPQPSVWLLDSGCSSHMTGKKELFQKLDETQKHVVKLGDNKEIQVAGKGSIAVTTQHGETKLNHNVQFVPNLAHNLLSVGQIVANGYILMFKNRKCRTVDEKIDTQLMSINQNKNNLYPTEFTQIEHSNVVVSDEANSLFYVNSQMFASKPEFSQP